MQVECCLLPTSAARPDELHDPILALLRSTEITAEGQALDFASNPLLASHLRHIRLYDVAQAATAQPVLHIHPIFDEEAEEEDGNDGETVAFQLWTLPALEFEGLWESLIFDDVDLQARLLRYVSTAMHFSTLGVDSRVIAWNRVVLLHGPPGTGKTSLCKGLAHKLAVRLSSTYGQGYLVEVNAHSLFSKWFSESGKLVMAMFARIREILEDGVSLPIHHPLAARAALAASVHMAVPPRGPRGDARARIFAPAIPPSRHPARPPVACRRSRVVWEGGAATRSQPAERRTRSCAC